MGKKVRFACGLGKVPRYFVKTTAVVLLKYRGTFCKPPRYFILIVGETHQREAWIGPKKAWGATNLVGLKGAGVWMVGEVWTRARQIFWDGGLKVGAEYVII